MYRQAQLASSAQALRRQIWASLPLKVRFAHFVRNAFNQWQPINLMIHAAMLKDGVKGMPPIGGMPGEEFVAQAKDRNGRSRYEGRNGTNRLIQDMGSNYGAKLGRDIWAMVVSFLGRSRMHDAEDVLSDWADRFLKNENSFSSSNKYSEAISFVKTKFSWLLKNEYAKQKTRQKYIGPDSMSGEDGEALSITERARDMEDLGDAIEHFDDVRQIQKILMSIKPKLERLAPWAWDYVRYGVGSGWYHGFDTDFLRKFSPVGEEGAPLTLPGMHKPKKKIKKVVQEAILNQLG